MDLVAVGRVTQVGREPPDVENKLTFYYRIHSSGASKGFELPEEELGQHGRLAAGTASPGLVASPAVGSYLAAGGCETESRAG